MNCSRPALRTSAAGSSDRAAYRSVQNYLNSKDYNRFESNIMDDYNEGAEK